MEDDRTPVVNDDGSSYDGSDDVAVKHDTPSSPTHASTAQDAAMAAAASAPASGAPGGQEGKAIDVVPGETLVVVSGATGFIASHIVEQLLEAGYRVRGTVRDPSKAERVAHLRRMPGAQERLELVAANLLDEASCVAACEGAHLLLHTASPFTMNVKDPQKDLVDPAIQGTLAFLRAAKQHGIRRTVVTSSMAAITDSPPDSVLTEADWNTQSSLKRNPYYYSKTMAERAAWEYAEAEGIDLVTINPFLVAGPAHTSSLNESNRVMQNVMLKQIPGVLDFTWGIVHVRDVARAHVLAMTAATEGRHLCCAHKISMADMCVKFRHWYPQYNLPSVNLSGGIGTLLAKASSYFRPRDEGTYIRTNIGRPLHYDNSKIREKLGMEFTDVDTILREAVEGMIEWGHIPDLRPHALQGDEGQRAIAALRESETGVEKRVLKSESTEVFSSHDAVTVLMSSLTLHSRTRALRLLEALVHADLVRMHSPTSLPEGKHLKDNQSCLLTLPAQPRANM